ncbi:serine hydrolase domain-containing protein [Maricaulis sp.]|uniref:serine hydrolase domain-containing protein n=1 Tax=Maricaulis sp. TaxID=1486257 RepID=UPI00261E520D|nr:serine hydrolase domain-containing protein [Maricaulis sp.]
MPRQFFLVLSALFVMACGQQADTTPLHASVQEVQSAHPELPGLAVWVEGGEMAAGAGAAFGHADPDGRVLNAQTPVRIASNTKTYVAAAYLRLWEEGLLPLDEPINGMIDPEFDRLLSADGYRTDLITPRHLLMHNAGMPDHADDTYVAAVFEDTQRQWTRADQVEFLTANHDPIGGPGERFVYSDTGYILLGRMIERVTGEPLSAAVRRLLRFDALGLDQTWWEQAEQAGAEVQPRAHQYLGDMDTTGFNGSLDLYGGGGLIASPRDLARFWRALFRGEVFADAATLNLMIEAPGQVAPERYRLGVFIETIDGATAYSHSGFWGTYAVYIPERDLAIAAVVLDQSEFGAMRALVHELAADDPGSRVD